LAIIPRLVNFSGRAVDAQAKPIAGIAGVTLAIYKDQYGCGSKPEHPADAKGTNSRSPGMHLYI
jgi:hypothetical protein